MVRSVRLPVRAGAAVSRSTVRGANPDVLAVEVFQPRTIRVRVPAGRVSLRLDVGFPVGSSTALLGLVLRRPPKLVAFDCARAERDQAGIEIDNKQKSDIGDRHEKHEDRVQYKERYGRAGSVLSEQEPIHCQEEHYQPKYNRKGAAKAVRRVRKAYAPQTCLMCT